METAAGSSNGPTLQDIIKLIQESSEENKKRTEEIQKQNEEARQQNEETRKRTEEIQKQIQESKEETAKQMQRGNEEIQNKIQSNKEEAVRQNEALNKRIELCISEFKRQNENMQTSIEQRIKQSHEELQKQIESTAARISNNMEAIDRFREEVTIQLCNVDDQIKQQREENKLHCEQRMQQIGEETRTKCEETIDQRCTEMEKITTVRINGINATLETNQRLIDAAVNEVKTQVASTSETLDQVRIRDISTLQEELAMLRNRPAGAVTACQNSPRETLKFRNYESNPMDYIQRLDELLRRTGENRWDMIRAVLDDGFSGVEDHWWPTVRNDIASYVEFKGRFKNKYWSEVIQSRVRDELCNGQYRTNGRLTATAYFLMKICRARYLEPIMTESDLVTRLSHHFNQSISQARYCRKIESVAEMTELLDGYEQEDYYARTRRRHDQPTNNNDGPGRNQNTNGTAGNNQRPRFNDQYGNGARNSPPQRRRPFNGYNNNHNRNSNFRRPYPDHWRNNNNHN